LIHALLNNLEAPGLPRSTALKFYSDISARYNEPWRHYHTLRHLGDVAGYLLHNASELRHPRATLWAALSHDEVYIPQCHVNEELSAQLAENRLAGWLPDDEVAQVGAYIRATANHDAPENDHDLQMLLDADLKILGSDTATYARYEQDIRREYDFVSERDYTIGRLAVLRSFEERPRLFATETARGQFEDRAHENLRQAIADHERRLAALSSGN